MNGTSGMMMTADGMVTVSLTAAVVAVVAGAAVMAGLAAWCLRLRSHNREMRRALCRKIMENVRLWEENNRLRIALNDTEKDTDTNINN